MAPLSKGAWDGLPPELVQLAASKADDESRCVLPSRGAFEGMVQLEGRARTRQRGHEAACSGGGGTARRGGGCSTEFSLRSCLRRCLEAALTSHTSSSLLNAASM